MNAIEIPTPDPRNLDDEARPFAESIALHYALKREIGRGGNGVVYRGIGGSTDHGSRRRATCALTKAYEVTPGAAPSRLIAVPPGFQAGSGLSM